MINAPEFYRHKLKQCYTNVIYACRGEYWAGSFLYLSSIDLQEVVTGEDLNDK